MPTESRLWGLWTPYAGDDAQSRAEWADLIERWSEPQRIYHTLEHLLLMLHLLSGQDAEPATMLAAWYHDAIYDPRSPTNEADSADLAEAALTRLGLGELTGRVRELIALTAGHDCAPDRQAALLLDADLAILGQPPGIYLRYVEAVRREYAHVPDEQFIAARTEILNRFLSLDRIYRHGAFASLEDRARANLAAEIAVYQSADDD